MKKGVVFVSIVSTIMILVALSCSIGLEPAKSGTTSVSFTIGTLIPPANTLANLTPAPGRAVAPDYGYLYIRTLGGAIGSKGPFYGPFRLESGKTFTTTDIPAGTYQGIGLLYATEPLESLTGYWNDQEMTFTELMSLPDTDFALFSDGDPADEGPSPLDELLDGYASGEILQNVTIQANRSNTLSATLVPLCGLSFNLDTMHSEYYAEYMENSALRRQFFRLDEIHQIPGATLQGIKLTIDPVDGSATINRIMLFSSDGVLRQTIAPNAVINTAQTYTLNYTDDNFLYLYLEYDSTEPLLSLTGILQPATPYSKLLFVSSDGTGDGGSPDTPLPSDALSDALPTAGANTAVYFMDDCAFTGDVSLNTYRYLLTSITREQRTITFDASSLSGTNSSNIMLTNIILDGSEWHNASLVTLSGLSGAVEFTLADRAVLRNRDNTSNSTGGGAILVGDSCTVTMETGSEITNCTSDNVSGGAVCITLASLNGIADFIMNGGEISACSAAYGGAVSIDDSPDYTTPSFTLQGGTISGCEAFVAGGAVSVRASYQSVQPKVYIRNGSIESCNAPHGGALYSYNSTFSEVSIELSGGTIQSCTATGDGTNTSGRGGALFAETGDTSPFTFIMSGGTILECNAYGLTDQYSGLGGAVYLLGDNMGIVRCAMSGGIIRDCTAHDSGDSLQSGAGGAFYIMGGTAQLELTNTARIENCNATQGWGLNYTSASNIQPGPTTQPDQLKAFFFGEETNIWYTPE